MPAQSRMPEEVVSAADAALGELAGRAAGLLDASGGDLAGCFGLVPDPRDPRGIRHSLAGILAACTAAVLCGCCSPDDVTTWVSRAGQEILAPLGCRRDALGVTAPPHPDTITRVLALLGAQGLADHAATCSGPIEALPSGPLSGSRRICSASVPAP